MSKKKFLFFDTETTGLPVRWGASTEDLDNWPRIIQLAFIVADEDGTELFRYKELIKPDGWVIPKEDFWIDNGFSTEENEEKGVPIFEALRALQDNLKIVDYKVAHNINFDNPVTGAEILRAGITYQLFQFKKGICTMNSSTKFCNLPGRYGKPKWPKLLELHKILFDVEFDGAHDAMADVTATKDCFFELIKRGVIKIN